MAPRRFPCVVPLFVWLKTPRFRKQANAFQSASGGPGRPRNPLPLPLAVAEPPRLSVELVREFPRPAQLAPWVSGVDKGVLLDSLIREAALDTLEVDPAACQRAASFCKHYLGKEPRPHSGVEVESQLLGVSRNRLGKEVLILAGAVAESSNLLTEQFVNALLAAVKKGKVIPVAVVCSTFYDETPLSIRVSRPRRNRPKRAKAKAKAKATSSRESRKPQVTKVLQTDARVAYLMKVSGQSTYTCVRLDVPSPLQVMDHATAENLKSALSHVWSNCKPLAASMRAFKKTVHLGTRDRGGSNLKYEACMMRDKQKKKCGGRNIAMRTRRPTSAGLSII